MHAYGAPYLAAGNSRWPLLLGPVMQDSVGSADATEYRRGCTHKHVTHRIGLAYAGCRSRGSALLLHVDV